MKVMVVGGGGESCGMKALFPKSLSDICIRNVTLKRVTPLKIWQFLAIVGIYIKFQGCNGRNGEVSQEESTACLV